jgi:hypothetical protein
MLRRVAIVKAEVSEESIASFIRVTRIGELGTTLAVTSSRSTKPKKASLSSPILRRIFVKCSLARDTTGTTNAFCYNTVLYNYRIFETQMQSTPTQHLLHLAFRVVLNNEFSKAGSRTAVSGD